MPCLFFVPAVARRFGWGYAGYVLVVMGIPLLGTKDFMSCGRYLLAAFPVFAVVGLGLAEPGHADPGRRVAPAALARGVGLDAGGVLLLVGHGQVRLVTRDADRRSLGT